ncbi:MAG: GFA family protein, partial [Hyphomicrobiaceae bacterium]|nr:GFA family protein [Hyphomicrobiaceae bacterium]
MATARTGGCLCGAVKFAATPKPHDDGVHVDACHCAMCRRQVGGPLMAVACDKVEVTAGAYLGVYQSSAWAERCFCKRCGS